METTYQKMSIETFGRLKASNIDTSDAEILSGKIKLYPAKLTKPMQTAVDTFLTVNKIKLEQITCDAPPKASGKTENPTPDCIVKLYEQFEQLKVKINAVLKDNKCDITVGIYKHKI